MDWIDHTSLATLARSYNLDLVILYGSRATGHLHLESDTDIGVWRRSGPLPAEKFLELEARLYAIFPPGDLDVVDLGRASGLLKHVAAEEGIVLYEAAPGDFAHYRVLAWNLYQDERIAIRRHDSEAIRLALEGLRR